MKFLIDASLPAWMIDAFAEEAHEAVHADDLGLGHAPDEEVAREARRTARCVITRDFDFADLRNYDPRLHRGIVVLSVPRDRGSPYMRVLLNRLFEHMRAGGSIEGKLLIVEVDRIRTRGV